MKPKDSFFLLIYNNTIEKKYEIKYYYYCFF